MPKVACWASLLGSGVGCHDTDALIYHCTSACRHAITSPCLVSAFCLLPSALIHSYLSHSYAVTHDILPCPVQVVERYEQLDQIRKEIKKKEQVRMDLCQHAEACSGCMGLHWSHGL